MIRGRVEWVQGPVECSNSSQVGSKLLGLQPFVSFCVFKVHTVINHQSLAVTQLELRQMGFPVPSIRFLSTRFHKAPFWKLRMSSCHCHCQPFLTRTKIVCFDIQSPVNASFVSVTRKRSLSDSQKQVGLGTWLGSPSLTRVTQPKMLIWPLGVARTEWGLWSPQAGWWWEGPE